MAVPYIFSTVAGGSSIPLAELDANFAYLTTAPVFAGNVAVNGNLSVLGASTFTGASTFNSLVTMNNGLTLNGPFTINGSSVNPTGTTGTNLLVFNNGPTLVAPILGTPASGNLSLCTGYPVNQIAGMAPGIIPFLMNPTTANLGAAVVDETGTGNLVLSNNPVLVSPQMTTPILGVPSSGDLTNCTGFVASNLVGVTPVVNGGTGMSTTGAVGDVLIVSAPGVLSYVPSPPAAGLAGGVASELVYQSAPNTTSFLPNGTLGQVLTSNGAAAPSWGLVNATLSITGILPIANGGTGLSTLGTGVQTALSNPVDQPGGLVTYNQFPAGAVMFFAMATAPAGWLFANGAAVSRTLYANLFAAIGVTYGPGNGSTTFNLPNLNGQFIRGWDASGAVDPGRVLGSTQAQSFASHNHGVTDPGHSHPVQLLTWAGHAGVAGPADTPLYNGSFSVATAGSGTGISVNSTGGSETRPTNVALYACIKY